MSRLLEESDVVPPQADELPTYIVEVAKSGRAECKKCDCKIENKCIRIGVIVDGEWGLFTRWQHLDCTVFHKGINSVEELDGFSDLNTQQKDLVKERFALSANEVDEDMQPIDPDELVRKAWEKPVEPSPNLLMPLLPYQKEGLGWMVNQEQNDVHGGILADEMGMGKTIQAIALMLQNRPDMSDFAQLREWAASDARHAAPAIVDSSKSSSSSSSEGPEPMVRCGTLIVLPTVAIRQWQTEIARFTKEGSLTVKVYHGSDRNTSALDLTKTDIVLTSYKILEIEYRKATAGTKVTCRVCQKKFYPDKLRVHRKYFCGESAQRTAAQALTQKKKARTGAKNSTTPTRPDASATKTKNNRKRPRNAFGVTDTADADCEEEEGEIEEEEPSGSASKRPRGGKNGAKAKGTATVGKGKGAGKGNGKGRDKGKEVNNDSDSSPHSSSGEDENEGDREEENEDMPPVKAKGRAVTKPAAAPAAAGKGKKTVEIKTEPVDTSKRGASQVKIKTEPGTEDMETSTVPISAAKTKKQATSKQQKAAADPVSSSKAPTKGKRKGAAQKDTAGSAYWPNIDAPDSPTSSSSDAEDQQQNDNVVSSGSDLDAPTTSRHTPRGRKSPAPAPVPARGRKTPPTSSAKAAPMSGVKAEPGTISVTVTPLRAPTRRAAAQGQKKYTDDTRDSDFDVASSDEDVVANKKKGNNKQVKLMLAAEEAELDVDSEFEIEAEEEEKAGASSCSEGENDSGSDLPSESEEEEQAVLKGRARGGDGNIKGKVTPAKKSVAPSRSPANGKGRASPASSASAKGTSVANGRSRGSAASNSKKVSAGAKGKAAVGRKRPAAGHAHAQSDDDDDVAWESGSDNTAESSDDSNSATDSDGEGAGGSKGRGRKNKSNKAGSDDSEVERDIQRALLEAAAAQRRSKQGAAVSVLHMVSWFRIILDEAHLIKDRSTSTAKAVFNLTSLNKWCLTGTPLQNRVGELYSLIRFLRVDPHAFYYCRTKGCCCKSLHYRFTKSYCDDCHHSVIQHYCHFNKHILNPIKRSGYVADGRRAMLKLKQQVLDEILLRRTKTTRAEDIQLPPRVVTVRSEKLDVKEEDFYSALYTQSQAQFNTYLQSGTVLNNYAHIFDILIRLRQAVDHPYLVIYSEAQVAKQDDSENYLNLSSGNNHGNDGVKIKTEPNGVSGGNCDLCHEPCEDPVSSTSCDHTFCRLCITDYIGSVSTSNGNGIGNNNSSGLRCPDCDQPLTIQLLPSSPSTTTAATVLSRGANRLSSSNGRNGSSAAVDVSGNGDVGDAVTGDQQQQDSVSVWNATKGLSRKSILDKVDLNLFQSSTKIEALMEELHKMQSEDLGAKAIVFSQFVNMLDLISYRLQRGGLQCVKLSGSMSLEQRDKCISAFKADPNVKVMLISLKAGGVALNLTVASRIFLMDPWWNPAAEMQAIDRTHRIGQHKPIFATRFIIENTIEERILRLQEKKKLVFDGTVGGDSGSMSKLTVDDMRFLFN